MKVVLGVEELVRRVESIAIGLMTLSRLYALGLLAAADTRAKLEYARQSSVFADAAALVHEFLGRYFQRPGALVAWPDPWHPQRRDLLTNGRVLDSDVSDSTSALAARLSEAVASLMQVVADDVCASPVEPVLVQLESLLQAPPPLGRLGVPVLLAAAHSGPPRKAVDGPKHVATDPVFRPAFSLRDQSIPHWTLASEVAVPHFWTVCIKETVGAELCALSVVEYDGLPVAFYRDLAKQAWDEMRHAQSYLKIAIRLIPDLLASLETGDPLAADLTTFQQTGRGLPIPIERNLYEAIWNSTLAERLVLFQVDTEVPGSARKVARHNRSLERHPDLARAIEYDLRDEKDHTRIGRTWLKYLVPDPAERRELVRTTRLLRGVLVLTAFAHYGGRDLGGLVAEFTASGETG
jgi:hypothetical protein